MNIAIIVYSRTGHTLSVAEALGKRLSADGHEVTLEQLEIEGPVDLSAATAKLKARPSIAPYDGLVLGTPVNGGRMSAAMNSYLEQVPTLHGKRVAFLLTHFFVRGWGANQTVRQMTEVCQSKGADVRGTGTVRWTGLGRRRRISTTLDEVAGCFDS